LSEFHEETHYQIALTNRQVLTAFVILLGCLFVAFFAGVRIGRDVWAGAGNLAAATVPEGFETDDTNTGLGFFTRTDGKRHSAEPDDTDRLVAQTPSSNPEPLSATSIDRVESSLPSPEVMRAGELAERSEPRPPEPSTGNPTIIQVFSSTDRAQAESILERLSNAGFEGYISPFTIDGQSHYRVRVGPLPDRAQAIEQASRLESDFGLDTWIPSTID